MCFNYKYNNKYEKVPYLNIIRNSIARKGLSWS
jgi:hypothetical protein